MNESQKQELKETLSDFGLNAKDQIVYLALLKIGETTLSPLARKAELPLTTVQSVMPRLAQKGLIHVSKRKSRHLYEAHDPMVFKDILKEQATAIAMALPILQGIKSSALSESRVRVFERERISEILNESLKAKDKCVYEIVSAGPFQKLLGEKYHYTRRRVQADVSLKSLRVRSTEIKKYNARTHRSEKREARFLPKELTFEANILFWDDTVAILSTKSEGVHVLIKSKSIRVMFAQLFDLLWSVSGKMETLAESDESK